MTRLLIFLIVIGLLAFYFWKSSAPKPAWKNAPALPKKRKDPLTGNDEFWAQVYDTDSKEEALLIQTKFRDMSIECVVYEQGKKDVFGSVLKHYGISVPRKKFDKAQDILART